MRLSTGYIYYALLSFSVRQLLGVQQDSLGVQLNDMALIKQGKQETLLQRHRCLAEMIQ